MKNTYRIPTTDSMGGINFRFTENELEGDICIRLKDMDNNPIYVNDILYYKDRDMYFTVFEVPGGYGIEGNPEAFGLYDPDDPFPVYDSLGEAQTSSFVSHNLKVVGTIHDKLLYNKIKSKYEEKSKNR